MKKVLLVVASALSVVLSFPAGSHALENGQDKPRCFKSAEAMGMPHRIQTIAQISAVRAWMEQVKKQGEEFSMWHNAHSGRIKCEKPERSSFFRCTATGKPCRAVGVAPGQHKKPEKH